MKDSVSSNAQSTALPLATAARLAEVLFWPARILLLAMLLASPWYYGSVTWQAQSYFVPATIVVFSLAIAGAVLCRQSVANPLVWSVAALLLLALLQTLTLPDWLWQSISCGAAFERSTLEAFSEFQGALEANAPAASSVLEVQPTPRTLSIHWIQSRASATMLAVALAALVSAGILFRTRTWELVVLGVLATSTAGISMLGLLQSVAWNKWTLLPMPTSSYFATFVSRNSAPQFICIGLGAVFGLLAWWTSTKSDGADKKYYVRYPAVNAVARLRRRLEELLTDLDAVSLLCVFAATLMFVAVLAASSRGGILACFAASILTLCVSLGSKQSYARTIGLVTVIVCGATLLMTTLELDSALVNRMDSVNEEAYELDNGRFTVWQMLLTASWIWLPGCGLGNFHFAILPTYSEPTAWFYHAENIYLEVLAELGIVGFVICMVGLGWLFFRVRSCVMQGRRAAPSFVATVLATAGVGLQNLVDFSLILPAIFLSLSVLIGCFISRSYCSDFGKKSKRTNQRRKTRDSADAPNATNENASSPAALASTAIIAVIVFAATGLGYKPLSGFAFAEQIESRLKQATREGAKTVAADTEAILQQLDTARVARFAEHPEVNLVIGRVYQSFAAASFKEQLKWPAGLTELQKASLSEPASIAASFRSKQSDPRMQQLHDLVIELPQQVETLHRSSSRMAAAASVCAFDWRGQWGLVRSDLSLLSVESRARNYARLLKSTVHSSTVPIRVGSAALMAQEKAIAVRVLHDFVARVPAQAVAISSIVVERFAADKADAVARELEAVLPSSALLRVAVAEQFSNSVQYSEVATQLAANIDIEQLVAEAKSQPAKGTANAKAWLMVNWLARVRSDTGVQAEALLNAATADPMNHGLRFELAKLLLQIGNRSEAILQAERASRLAPESRPYKEFLRELEPQNENRN